MDKTITKPWGKEVWLELNEKYCYKRIYINAGHRTSYQYHEKKTETNYIISGKAEVWVENKFGEIEKNVLIAGEYITVNPMVKHRVCAITDIILQEVSTPEVNDVIRIEDDTHRESGLIKSEHLNPAICIVAAGKGSRLKSIGKQIHKGLLPINNKAVISHIIDKVPEDFDIIIAIGYKGNLIKEYCEAAYPDRFKKMTFVEVDDIDGVKSGPGYSTLVCKEYLQRPFYWIASDCIIDNDLPLLDDNWMGLYPTSIPELYSTADIDSDMNIVSFKNKDKNGYDYAYIGLAGILDFETFWNELETNMVHGEVVSAFYHINKYKSFKAKMLDWYDVGTIESYMKAQKLFNNSIQYSIPKSTGEFLYKVDDNFIKLFSDPNITKNRIVRSSYLSDVIPKLQFNGNNIYSYKWIPGQTLYDLNDVELWKEFIEWIHKYRNRDYVVIIDYAKKFYVKKTYNRLESLLLNKSPMFTMPCVINNIECLNIRQQLDKINWKQITEAIAITNFHGDLQFDNVMYGTDKKFFLVDWRQDFGGCVTHGDLYYDLAKLYGGMLMSYKLMKDDNNFSISRVGDYVDFDYEQPNELDEIRLYYENWLINNDFNLKKVQILTALIFLNMAPLHNYPLNDLLFFKSRYMLQKLL